MSTSNTNHLESHRPTLPTSRASMQQERSVFAILRGLAPRRRLSMREALLLAELQANRLLELAGLPQAPVPSELISELPRVRVRRDPDLPVSGSAHWSSGSWQLTINASEPWTRQRFSLAHELKHCLDHRHVDLLYGAADETEAAADYFAACLLMPKRLVKRHWGQGVQSVNELAQQFAVSPIAMARRLEHLGLRNLSGYRPHRQHSTRKGRYTRNSTRAIGVSA